MANKNKTQRTLNPLFSWRGMVASDEGPSEPTTRHVLLTLSLHMNEKGGSCFPSITTLEKETKLARRTILRHIKKATQSGWLSIRKEHQGGNKWRRNNYTATIPASDRLSPDAGDRVSQGGDPLSQGGDLLSQGGDPNDTKVVTQDHSSSSLEDVKEDANKRGAGENLFLDAADVIAFLNEKTERLYPIGEELDPSFASLAVLNLLERGYTTDTMRQVIARKCRTWLTDPKRSEWLAPKTLFNPEYFENYAAECV